MKKAKPRARPSRRPKAPKLDEKEFVRETVSAATGVTFEVVAPHPAFPLPLESLDWFMRCRRPEEIPRSPYLNTVWKEKGGGIWLESLAVGDTVDWIDLAYGEEQAGKSIDLDYSRFEDPAFQEDFRRRFPIVFERIREHEKTAADVGKRARVHLEIRRAGSRGMLVFTVAAMVKAPKGASVRSLGNALKKGVAALKEAYEKVEEV